MGNPEPKYDLTRHNVGKLFINDFAEKSGETFLEHKLCKYFIYKCVNPNKSKKLPPTKVLIVKPYGFMNEQGGFIKAIRNSIDSSIEVDRIKVICDDLETDIGKVKFSKIGGDRGHNGLKSMQQVFTSNDFEKIKIGIGRPISKDPEQVADYVLKKFPEEHLIKIRESVYPKIIKAINLL